MKTRLTLALILFTASFATTAQDRFGPGYIVSIMGDTLRGEIEDRDWKINPSSIRFRKTSSDPIATYFPTQLKSFYLGRRGERFQSFRMVLDQSPAEKDQITEENFNAKAEKIFFARVIVKGIVSLFYVNDFKPHYIIDKDGLFQELRIQHKPVRTSSSVTTAMIGTKTINLQTTPLYHAQLITLMHDCEQLTRKIQLTPFQLKHLKALVLEYNACVNIPSTFVQPTNKGKSEFRLAAGAMMTTNKIHGFTPEYLVNASYKPVYSPTIGLQYIHVFARNDGLYGWHNELSYVSFRSKSDYRINELYDNYYYNYSNISAVRLRTGARFRFDRYKLSPFVSVGVGASLSLNSNFYTIQERYFNGELYDTQTHSFSTRNVELSYWLNAGFQIVERLDLYVTLDKPDGYSPAAAYRAVVSQYSLNASFRLNKK